MTSDSRADAPANNTGLIVDAHHHLWNLDEVPQPWITGEAMEPIDRSFSIDDLRAAVGRRVDRTVMVQTVAAENETPLMLQTAQNSELIGGVVGWVDLTASDVATKLAALQARPDGAWLVGIRHLVQGEPDTKWLIRDDVIAGLGEVAAADLMYDLLTIPEQLPAAIEAASRLEELRFVVDHLSKPLIKDHQLEPWATDIRRLAKRSNVTCKLSGMVTEADWHNWTVEDLRPYAETVLEAFGPERVMYGSDWPVCLLAASYEQVIDTAETLLEGCTSSERAAVMGLTAVDSYRLDRVDTGDADGVAP